MTAGTVGYSIDGATTVTAANLGALATAITNDVVGADLTANYQAAATAQFGVYTLDLTGLDLDTTGGVDTLLIGGVLAYTATTDTRTATEIGAALDGTTITLADGVDYLIDATDVTAVTLTAQTAVDTTADLAMTVSSNSTAGAVNATDPAVTMTTDGVTAQTESLTITGPADGTAFTIAFDTSAATGLTSITNAVTTVGVAAIATGSDTVTGLTADHLTSVDSGVVAGLTSSNAAALDIAEGDLVINGVDMAGTYGDNSTLGGARAALEAAIQAIDGLGDSSINALGVIKLIANDGQDLNIAGVDADATHTFKLAEGVTNQSAAGTVEIFSKEAVTVGGNAETSFGLTEGTSKVTDNGASLDSIDVTSRNSAEIAILIADSALTSLDATRSDLGSVQNQLESTIRNISVTQVNVTAAESQIRDVDFAAESANFAKLNILAQSGSYAMSQANAVQQNVLRLLQ